MRKCNRQIISSDQIHEYETKSNISIDTSTIKTNIGFDNPLTRTVATYNSILLNIKKLPSNSWN